MLSNQPGDELIKKSLHALEFSRLREELTRLAETEPAREKLATLSPSRDVDWIRDEIKRVDEIKGLMDRGSSLSSGGMFDVRPVLKRAAITGSVLSAEELLIILHHIRVQHTARRVLDKEREKLPLVYRLTKPLQSLPDLTGKIENAITPEATVRDRASKELTRIRHGIAVLQIDIRKRISSLVSRFKRQGVLRGESFTIRDGRYVLPVRSDAMRKVRGIVHDRSSTGGTIFIEPGAVIDLGNEFRALELAERDEIRRILRELTEFVYRDIDQIQVNLDVMTAIDCIWAKARLAELMDAYQPVVNPKGPIRIVHGRHPLLALDGNREVVPLDLELGDDYTCLVISGPNAGGKSVALKCVGLMCVMTACGLHVPALPGTEIPLFEDYHAVIGDLQSISDDLSTFSAHTMQLKDILNKATSQTLVLVDEVGVGTDPQEGASLSIAVLERLAERKVPTIVTTHHGALKAFAHSTDGCANGSMEFDHETFQPTYRFHPNLPGSSYALDIARRVGLPDPIISRAREILGEDRTQLDELIHNLTEKLRRYETLVAGQEKHSAEYSGLEKAYREKLQRLKTREKELKQRAKHEVEATVKEARRSIEALVREIRTSQASRESIKAAHSGLGKVVKQAVSNIGKPPLDVDIPQSEIAHPPADARFIALDDNDLQTPSTKFIHSDRSPEVGDWIVIDDSVTKGEVTTISARGDRACVIIGSVQLWINVERLTIVKPPKPEKPLMVFTKKPDVPLELDIRGLDASQAIERVDRYLYDGSSQGREQLGIIHGKGKGILSKAVRDHLKKHSVVESFRFGEYGEGDYGITVVQLKKKKK